MHLYECVILQVIKSLMGHGLKKCIMYIFKYFTKIAKNMNNPYTTWHMG